MERMTSFKELLTDVLPLVVDHLVPNELYNNQAGDAAIRRLARRVKRIDRLVRVARADAMGSTPETYDGFKAGEWLIERAKELEVKDSAPVPIVMGRHLIELGQKPGPGFTPILDACYDAQIEGEISTLEEGIALVRTLLGKTNVGH
jgi:tRNA nucleotidyltransferase (CCA-adding enzyme)